MTCLPVISKELVQGLLGLLAFFFLVNSMTTEGNFILQG
jgi:hypothetical protein